MPYCFAPGCSHVARRETCSFYRFPSDKKLYNQWKKMARRKDRDPGKHDVLCSCHFVGGNKQLGPTIFQWNVGKQMSFPSPEKRKRIVKEIQEDPVPSTSAAVSFEATEDVLPEVSLAPGDALSNAEMYFLQRQNADLKEKLEEGDGRFSINQIASNDSLVFKYTGLPTFSHFMCLCRLLARFDLNYYLGWRVTILTHEDQLFCCLMKLRLNLLHFDLGFRFKISDTTIQNIVFTYIYALHEVLFVNIMDKIPSTIKNNIFLPACFAQFSNCRVVLDCTEFEVARPPSIKNKKVVFSHYKQRHTFKVLIGISPNATITYVSEMFPGSASDKTITKESGVLSHLVAGDLILADKGFLIADMCREIGVSVNIPPFLANQQLTPAEVLRTRQIARARIHVERAINRLKNFKILDFIAADMREHASTIVQTCAALVNMQYSLLHENEQSFSATL